jgi:hypothetical protein
MILVRFVQFTEIILKSVIIALIKSSMNNSWTKFLEIFYNGQTNLLLN